MREVTQSYIWWGGRIWNDSHLFSAQNSLTKKAECKLKFSCWRKQSCEFHFQVALALHFPADAVSCQCINVHLQFVFLEESHNIPKKAICGSLFFRRRRRQKHTYFLGFLVCFLIHYTLVAEMRPKICTKYTSTTHQEQHATLILHVKSEHILLTPH
jgi:hypothetical protein